MLPAFAAAPQGRGICQGVTNSGTSQREQEQPEQSVATAAVDLESGSDC